MIKLLDDAYRIKVDAYNYIVCIAEPAKNRDTGETYTKYLKEKYFTSLVACLEFIIDNELKKKIDNSEIDSIIECTNQIKDLLSLINMKLMSELGDVDLPRNSGKGRKS